MPLAQLRAGLTDFGALGANMRVMRRTSGHKVHAGDGDLRAVHQRHQVGGLVMSRSAASVQHLGGRFGAKPVGGEARFDAVLHVHGVFSRSSVQHTASSRTLLINGKWDAGVPLR